jgi:beta-N-acetylhexosaminidase
VTPPVALTLPLLAVLVVACATPARPPDVRSPLPTAATATATATASAAAPSAPTPSPTAAVASAAAAIPSCSAAAELDHWTTERLAWQVIVVPAQVGSLSAVDAQVGAGAGGVLLFGSTAPGDLAAELVRLESRAPAGITPLVMSDIEGGDVERAANLLGPMPSARRLAQTMTPAQIEAYALSAGRRMRAIGITMDLAPVMDLDAGPGPTADDPDGTRSFSDDPGVATADSGAFAAGLAGAGVMPVAKHFPGLHGAGDNTDLGPAQTSPWSQLQQRGLVPFVAAVKQGQAAVMLSNASVPGLSTLPSSISPQVVAVLRQQLGFTGLILTDSLSAGAIAAIGMSVPDASVAALVAGADMVLYSVDAGNATSTARAVAATIAAAVVTGRLPRAQLIASVTRVLAAKHVDLCAGSRPAS